MEKMKYYTKEFHDDHHTVYHLEYALLVRSAEQGAVYGIEICKSDDKGNTEKECVDGLCENREEAEMFLRRLAEGMALPVELTALCDDYVSEQEK